MAGQVQFTRWRFSRWRSELGPVRPECCHWAATSARVMAKDGKSPRFMA